MTDQTATEPIDTTSTPLAVSPAAPADAGTLILTPPAPLATIETKQVEDVIPISDADKAMLTSKAKAFVDSVINLDPHSAEFASKVAGIQSLANAEIQQSSSVSNRMLDRPMASVKSGSFSQNAPVAKSLMDLRHQVEDLDPSKEDLFSEHRLLGFLPFHLGNKARNYFDKYKSAQSHINGIITALYHGKDELTRDNADIEQEKLNLWAMMGRLQQYEFMVKELDSEVSARIAQIQATDPARAKALNEEVLFYVRQKQQDILTQMAVATQGYMALDIIRRNNVELILGVDRATSTTVAALHTAVMVAQALLNEKLVLDQITAVNVTTGNMIANTSVLLRDTSAKVHEQAASNTINVEQLKTAFANIYATMDAIDTYKSQALVSMQQTVTVLSDEVGKAQTYLNRAGGPSTQEPAAIASPSNDLLLPGGTAATS